MAETEQRTFAEALRRLTVSGDGKVRGPVTAEAIQFATQVAGRLEGRGLRQAATTLRGFINQASRMVAPPKEEEKIPLPPQMPQSLQDRVQKTLQTERDPAKLQPLITALMPYQKTTAGAMAIKMVRALIVQIESQEAAAEALEATEKVLKAPTGTTTLPELNPTTSVLETPPRPLPVPIVPVPQPAPTVKSAAQITGEKMAAHLFGVQQKHGMPGAKGREDASVVMKFQRAAGLGADGKAGPGTLAKLASLKVGRLPLVMYWPRGSSRYHVQKYRDTLRRLAGQAESLGFDSVGGALRQSALREQGQGGISHYGPSLT
jgi:hypothetical protein